ncbi:MAG: energy transducer TonB [Saprospiraceae bacterium]
MTPLLLGFTTVLAMLYLYHARRNKVLKTDARLPRGQWSSHRLTFLNFGLVFALGFVTMAFEYETLPPVYDQEIGEVFRQVVEVEVIRTAHPEDLELPPPPQDDKVEKFNLLAELELVEDTQPAEDLNFIEDAPTPVPENVKVVYVAPTPPPAPPPPPPAPVDETDIFVVVEQMPMFPGCESAGGSKGEMEMCATEKMLQYIYARVRYPEIAKQNNVQGTAVISFVVEKDGTITGAKIVRDPGAMTGKAALDVVNSFPNWNPGMQRMQPVRVQFNLPIKFKLND